MKIAVVIQARMSSSRLPGKVLMKLGGVPLLELQYRALSRSGMIDSIVLATSDEPSDDPIETFASQHQIPIVRGSLENVAGRFVTAIERFGIEHVIRHCADRPFMDIRLLEQGIALYQESGADLVTNALGRKFPKGQTVEILRAGLLLKNIASFECHDDFEHVTQYFYRHQDRFQIREIPAVGDYSDVNLCLDTPADLVLFEKMMNGMEKPIGELGWQELADRYRSIRGS